MALKKAVYDITVINTLNRVREAYISNGIFEASKILLDVFVKKTNGKMGFISRAIYKDEKYERMQHLAISPVSWDSASESSYKSLSAGGFHLFFDGSHVLDVLKKGTTFKGDSSHEFKCPVGHPPLDTIAIFPIKEKGEGRAVGVVAISGHEGDIELIPEYVECIFAIIENDNLRETKKTSAADPGSKFHQQFASIVMREMGDSISNMMMLLTKIRETTLSKGQEVHVASMIKNGTGLLRMVNDITDLSKLENGLFTLSNEPTSIKKIMSMLRADLKGQFDEMKIQIHFKYSKNIPEFIWSDKTRLGQVLFNILNNALKFTKKGKVVVRTDVELLGEPEEDGEKKSKIVSYVKKDKTISFNIGSSSEGSESSDISLDQYAVLKKKLQISISVEDTGIGIRDSDLPKLFKPFSKLNVDKKYQGSGLGLFISKRIIEMMGGCILVESKWGQGTKFTIKIITMSCRPIIKSLTPQIIRKSMPLIPPEIPVLIFETKDSHDSRTLFEILENIGVKGKITKGASRAISSLNKTIFSAIFVYSGDADADEFVHYIKTNHPEIQIITFSSEEGDPDECHIVKPFTREKVEKYFEHPRISVMPFVHPKPTPINIAIIDENAISAEIFIKMLERVGYSKERISHFKNSSEFAKTISRSRIGAPRKAKPDLIFIAMKTSGAKGEDIAIKISGIYDGKKKPCPKMIAIAESYDDAQRSSCMLVMNGYTTRNTINVENLMVLIDNVMKMRIADK